MPTRRHVEFMNHKCLLRQLPRLDDVASQMPPTDGVTLAAVRLCGTYTSLRWLEINI